MSKNLVVFDIDGVLINSEHRINYFLEGKHQLYVDLARGDTVIPQGAATCRLYLNDPQYEVVFVTGRGESLNPSNPYYTHRFETLLALQNLVSPKIRGTQLLMRDWEPDAPVVPDTIKKPLMLEENGYSLDDIFIVFEDRQCIVDMWRERGITVYQTQRGDF